MDVKNIVMTISSLLYIVSIFVEVCTEEPTLRTQYLFLGMMTSISIINLFG